MSSRILIVTLIFALVCAGSLPLAAAPVADDPLPPPPGQEDILTDLSQMESFWLNMYGDGEAQALTGLWPLGMEGKLLAKAQPDECYDGIGSPYPPGPPCEKGQPKVNEAYVWGITKPDHRIWFGTAANVLCWVLGNLAAITGTPQSLATNSWVCEFGDSPFSPPLPAAMGDWRPPSIYTYDTVSETLTEVTPADPRIKTTLGIRSAGNLNNVVFLGGPAFGLGINLFAFRADTGAYLGSTTLTAYNNIRKWMVVDGVLYAGVRGRVDKKGYVLRWRGDVSNPFQFEEVGVVDSDAAELASHEGRIFVSTWPDVAEGKLASLWMSPPVPPGGLTAAHRNSWTRVWRVDAYEPDPVTARTYGGGALASFDGFLYWGTMHVPTAALLIHEKAYGASATAKDLLIRALGTHRAISIFRGRNFATTPQIDLLYGNPLLPAYLDGQWKIVPNKMGAMPLFGFAGINNFFNNYTWSMTTYAGQLFVGTMDWSYLFADLLVAYMQQMGFADASTQVHDLHLPVNFFGADLVRFPFVHHPAIPVSVAGLGNFTNYGIRNLLADDVLYVGTANPMNLLTDPNDWLPEGGWELIGLTVGTPPLVGWVFLDENGNGYRENNEVPGVGAVTLKLELYGHPAETTKSHGGDGWYQFDQVLPFAPYRLTALIPPTYVPTSPTQVDIFRHPYQKLVINFGVQRARATIGDSIWYDTNANGQWDADEYGLEGVTVALLADAGGAPGAVVATTTTDVNGAYLFDYVIPGTYWVKVTDEQNVLAGHTLTTGAQSRPTPYGPIQAVHQGVYREADFGYVIVPGPNQVVISDTVWRDLNGNGLRDPGEPGLSGVRVCAQPLSYKTMYCATTNGHGLYHIIAPPGTYLIAPVKPPVGLQPTTPPGSPGFYLPHVVVGGQSYLDVDFGYR